MTKFFKFFILLNVVIVSTLAICSDRPAIPTTPPLTITRSSPGISNFPTSTREMSMTLRVIPNEPCTAGSVWNIFSLSLQPPGGAAREHLTWYIDCDSRTIRFVTSWINMAYFEFPKSFSSSALGPLSIFWSLDVNAQVLMVLAQTELFLRPVRYVITTTSGLSIDANTKFYFCSGQDGASPKACTIPELVFEYRYYEGRPWTYANFGGTDPAITAFYPLTDGPKTLLTNSLDPTKYGYFGDKESNPTEGTSPTWHSSNSFITISAGQFLTFLLPSLSTTIYPFSSSFTFTAWVKITELQAEAATTIFSMHSTNGTEVGYKMTVAQSTRQLQLAFGSLALTAVASSTPITLEASNTWQLIGFTAHLKANKKQTVGLVFAGPSSYQFNGVSSYVMDFSQASVIRIGGTSNSFSGHVSFVRIMTPGAAVIKSTNLCSPDTSIEFGLGSFPLACSASTMMGSADNKCYSSCPTDTFFSSDTATPLCVACPIHRTTCSRTECFTCEANYILYQGSCLSSCPEKTYYDGTTCQNCPSQCKACNQTQCLSCNANDFLYQGDCIGSCPSKTYSSNSVCDGKFCRYPVTESFSKDCPANCGACNSNQCLTCDPAYLLYHGGCVGSCPAKTYSLNSVCQDCSTNCLACGSSQCSTCDPDFFLYKGGCVGSCPSKTYSTDSACYDCPTKCADCNREKCLFCEADSFLYQNDCVDSCPAKTYSDGSACQDCPTGCEICEKTKCSSCDSNYFFYQGSCLSSCPIKTYPDEFTCQNCPTGCSNCQNTECFTCETNYLLYQGDCVDSCPPRSYSDLASCVDCSGNCAECQADGCQICDDGYQLNAQKECKAKSSSTPSTITIEEAGSAGHISAGVIVGIVCGSVAAVIATVFLIKKYLFTIKRNPLKNRYLNHQVSSAREPTTPVVSPGQTEENELIP